VQAHKEQYHPRRRRVSFSLCTGESHSIRLKRPHRRLARAKLPLSVVPTWVTFREQTWAISRECRSFKAKWIVYLRATTAFVPRFDGNEASRGRGPGGQRLPWSLSPKEAT